ncbi:hypothetical protein [Olleya sp. R77988]|uniref:hypothetical protein n=1 Tax=Olleya sp. R77988 TaxID=3093875 RepID=UPI0037C69BFC
MNRDILNQGSCTEDWEKMKLSLKSRFCSTCKIDLADLTEKTIENIAMNHYGKQKCVALTNDQIDFFINYKKIKTIALASSLFIGTTFFILSYGQTVLKHSDSCLVKGTAFNNDKKVQANRPIYIYIKESDTLYETKTNENGEFVINLPKNCEIKYSNIKKLISKKTRTKTTINLRKVKLKAFRRNPGYF